MKMKKVKVCRYCGSFNDVKATKCNNWSEGCNGSEADFITIEIDINQETIDATSLGNQKFQVKTENEYMNRDNMSPRERWLQRFKEKK